MICTASNHTMWTNINETGAKRYHRLPTPHTKEQTQYRPEAESIHSSHVSVQVSLSCAD